jgi:peptide/nickel transport system substrate-binding protein
VSINLFRIQKEDMMKRRLITLLSLLLVSLLAACAPVAAPSSGADTGAQAEQTEGPRRGGTLNVGLMQGLQTLDPQSTTAHPTPHVALTIWEGLFAYGQNFEPVPELAESWLSSDDQMTWTFKLREGVKFHNGKEMTAEDVKASLDRWKTVSPRASVLATLTEVRVADPYTIEMVFSEPMGDILRRLLADDGSKAVIMPKEIADASPQGELTEIVGTGPYQFVEYRPDDYVHVVRYEEYQPIYGPSNYQGGMKNAYVDEIYFRIVPEASTRVAGLEQGELDIILVLPETEFQRLTEDEEMEPIVLQPPGYMWMFFNHRQGPLTNLTLRQAIMAALDMELVLRQVKSDPAMWQTYGGFFPSGSLYGAEDGSEDVYNQKNPEKAQELLEEAGYNNEVIRILTLQSEEALYRASVAIAEQLQAAGMNAELLLFDLATWVEKRGQETEFEFFITGGANTNPLNFATPLGGSFPGWYTSPEAEAIFAQMRVATSDEELKGLVAELQKVVYADLAVGHIGFQHQLMAIRSRVQDGNGTLPLGVLTLHNVWLSE